MVCTLLTFITLLSSLLYLYIRQNDKKIMRQPDRVAALYNRFSHERIHTTAESLAKNPVSVASELPLQTGRRYIVVGGAGFLGGWIVIHLLQRGENPKRIRIVDIRPPSRFDLKTGSALGVDFVQADISDAGDLHSAFTKSWPLTGSSEPEITVFNVVAVIRFYEKHQSLIPLSAKVNVTGTQNVIDASRACGATVLVHTSSGSVGVRSNRFLLAPWEREPKFFVQALRDDADLSSKPHDHHFSNYSYTKLLGERLVRSADRSVGLGGRILRTGCIRPGNGIYGPHGDVLWELYLRGKVERPSWILNIVQNFIYVENCSLAHLCYEQRLVELGQGGRNPDIGGDSFIVTDAGSPISYDDAYTTMHLLTGRSTPSFCLSSSAMLLLAHAIESYYLLVHFLTTSTFTPFRIVSYLLPQIQGDLINLQPSLWSLANVHILFDDSRAKASPEEGGLGYNPPWTTSTGLCKLVDEFKKNKKIQEDLERSSGLEKDESSIQGGLEALAVDASKVLN